MWGKDKGYISPSDFSQMITSFIDKNFIEYHPEIFADTLMMPTKDVGLSILKKYLSAMAWYLKVNEETGWNTARGRLILRRLATCLKDQDDYDCILEGLSELFETKDSDFD